MVYTCFGINLISNSVAHVVQLTRATDQRKASKLTRSGVQLFNNFQTDHCLHVCLLRSEGAHCAVHTDPIVMRQGSVKQVSSGDNAFASITSISPEFIDRARIEWMLNGVAAWPSRTRRTFPLTHGLSNPQYLGYVIM